VGLSSVKRYAATAREGKPLAPKRRPGSKPKLDEAARKLLEADLEERPAATLPQRRAFLARVAGVRVSDSTWDGAEKKIGGCLRARRVPEDGLAGGGRGNYGSGALHVLEDECSTNISLRPLYAWSRRGERARCSAPRNWGKNVTLLCSMTLSGMGPPVAVEEVLAPSLRPGQVVVMDNLTAHKGG
jgi:hypothetical protein